MSNHDNGHDFADVGERLVKVRRVLGLNQGELADRLNWQGTRLSNWETGAALIPPRELRRLKQIVPGLTSDWIYDGETNGLTAALLEQVNSLPPEDDQPTKKRGRPRKARG